MVRIWVPLLLRTGLELSFRREIQSKKRNSERCRFGSNRTTPNRIESSSSGNKSAVATRITGIAFRSSRMSN